MGAGIWPMYGNHVDEEPDIILCCAGDDIRRRKSSRPHGCCANTCQQLKVRVVNVVDLMCLSAPGRHPHAMKDEDFVHIFGANARRGDGISWLSRRYPSGDPWPPGA